MVRVVITLLPNKTTEVSAMTKRIHPLLTRPTTLRHTPRLLKSPYNLPDGPVAEQARTTRAFPGSTDGTFSANGHSAIVPEHGRTLYIGNLNPTTDYTTLRTIFKAFPHFAGLRMSKLPGFGFPYVNDFVQRETRQSL